MWADGLDAGDCHCRNFELSDEDAGACSPDVAPRRLSSLGWRVLERDESSGGVVRLYRAHGHGFEFAKDLTRLGANAHDGTPDSFRVARAGEHRAAGHRALTLELAVAHAGTHGEGAFTTRVSEEFRLDGAADRACVAAAPRLVAFSYATEALPDSDGGCLGAPLRVGMAWFDEVTVHSDKGESQSVTRREIIALDDAGISRLEVRSLEISRPIDNANERPTVETIVVDRAEVPTGLDPISLANLRTSHRFASILRWNLGPL